MLVDRRQFLRLSACGIAYPFFFNNKEFYQMKKSPNVVLSDEAIRIHSSSLVFDGHNDMPNKMRVKGYSSFEDFNLLQNQPDFQTDIPRLRKGGLGAQFWVANGTLSGKNNEGKSSSGYCLEDIELIHKLEEKYPADFEIAYSADDIIRIHKKGLIASLIGIEGSYAIENSLTVLDSFYRLGARYMTLTWGTSNAVVDSATDRPIHGGLSEFGVKVVLEMNKLGMLVDISHVSEKAMIDVLRISQSPVIASHSSAFALSSLPRNIPDHVLKGISKNGGIVCINFFPGYLTQESAKLDSEYWAYFHLLESDPKNRSSEIEKLMDKWDTEHPMPKCSVEKMVDHIDHIVKTAGIDHVGLGSDFDGMPFGPDYLWDVSYYPYITQSLLMRGYKNEAIHKILGGNLLRVLNLAEKMA